MSEKTNKNNLYLFSTIFYNLKLIGSRLERSEYKLMKLLKKLKIKACIICNTEEMFEVVPNLKSVQQLDGNKKVPKSFGTFETDP